MDGAGSSATGPSSDEVVGRENNEPISACTPSRFCSSDVLERVETFMLQPPDGASVTLQGDLTFAVKVVLGPVCHLVVNMPHRTGKGL